MDFTNMSDDMVYLCAKDAKARMDAAAECLSKANAELATRYPDTGTHTLTTGAFVVSENNTYDKNVIASILSPGQVRRVSALVIQNDAVKRLYPEAYAASKVTRGKKVTLR